MRTNQLSKSSVLARSLTASGLLFLAAVTACSGDVDESGGASGTGGNDGLAGETGAGGSATGGSGAGGGATGGSGATGGGAAAVDECAEGTDECPGDSPCEDLEDGYTCNCGAGYTWTGSACADLDECAAEIDGCPDDAPCEDLDGGYTCDCGEGYAWDGETCSDIDECAEEMDDCAGSCTNTDGGFECKCPEGLVGDGVTCCDPTGGNLALGATPTAMTTYPGYSVLKVNDGSKSTVQTQSESWCNNWGNGETLPQWVVLTFPEPRTIGRLEFYSSDGYTLADYDVEYWNGSAWESLAVITNNTEVHRTHTFDLVTTAKVRMVTRKGATQPTYHRINELELYCQ